MAFRWIIKSALLFTGEVCCSKSEMEPKRHSIRFAQWNSDGLAFPLARPLLVCLLLCGPWGSEAVEAEQQNCNQRKLSAVLSSWKDPRRFYSEASHLLAAVHIRARQGQESTSLMQAVLEQLANQSDSILVVDSGQDGFKKLLELMNIPFRLVTYEDLATRPSYLTPCKLLLVADTMHEELWNNASVRNLRRALKWFTGAGGTLVATGDARVLFHTNKSKFRIFNKRLEERQGPPSSIPISVKVVDNNSLNPCACESIMPAVNDNPFQCIITDRHSTFLSAAKCQEWIYPHHWVYVHPGKRRTTRVLLKSSNDRKRVLLMCFNRRVRLSNGTVLNELAGEVFYVAGPMIQPFASSFDGDGFQLNTDIPDELNIPDLGGQLRDHACGLYCRARSNDCGEQIRNRIWRASLNKASLNRAIFSTDMFLEILTRHFSPGCKTARPQCK